MGLLNETNLKSLIEKVPHNALVTTKWLEEQGFSRQLLSKYTKNNWLKKLTNGVFVKIGDEPSINGAIYALQEQLKSSIHIGGITASSFRRGYAAIWENVGRIIRGEKPVNVVNGL